MAAEDGHDLLMRQGVGLGTSWSPPGLPPSSVPSRAGIRLPSSGHQGGRGHPPFAPGRERASIRGPHKPSCCSRFANAAQTMTEEMRSILELDRAALRQTRSEVDRRLDAAIDALAEHVDIVRTLLMCGSRAAGPALGRRVVQKRFTYRQAPASPAGVPCGRASFVGSSSGRLRQVGRAEVHPNSSHRAARGGRHCPLRARPPWAAAMESPTPPRTQYQLHPSAPSNPSLWADLPPGVWRPPGGDLQPVACRLSAKSCPHVILCSDRWH